MDESQRAIPFEAFTERDLLLYIANMLRRLEPLIDTLEKATPMLGALVPEDGKAKPNPFKMAMAAAKLARGS